MMGPWVSTMMATISLFFAQKVKKKMVNYTGSLLTCLSKGSPCIETASILFGCEGFVDVLKENPCLILLK